MHFAVPTGFNWRAPLGPWRRIADLQRELHRLQREFDAVEHGLAQANERYNKIREANALLRETLTLYRNEAR